MYVLWNIMAASYIWRIFEISSIEQLVVQSLINFSLSIFGLYQTFAFYYLADVNFDHRLSKSASRANKY